MGVPVKNIVILYPNILIDHIFNYIFFIIDIWIGGSLDIRTNERH